MTTVKTPKAYNFRTNLSVTSIMLSWLIIIAIVTNVFEDTTTMKIVLFISFFLLVVALIWYLFKRQSGFKCPDCNISIPETVDNSGETGEPIMHYCKKCDVLWHTGNIPSS